MNRCYSNNFHGAEGWLEYEKVKLNLTIIKIPDEEEEIHGDTQTERRKATGGSFINLIAKKMKEFNNEALQVPDI